MRFTAREARNEGERCREGEDAEYWGHGNVDVAAGMIRDMLADLGCSDEKKAV